MNGGPLEEQILLSQVEGSIQKPPILISRNKPEDEDEDAAAPAPEEAQQQPAAPEADEAEKARWLPPGSPPPQ